MGMISREDDNGKALTAEEAGVEVLDISKLSTKEFEEAMQQFAAAYQKEQNNPDDRVISETIKKGHSR